MSGDISFVLYCSDVFLISGSAMGTATSGIAFGILAGPLLGGVLTTQVKKKSSRNERYLSIFL